MRGNGGVISPLPLLPFSLNHGIVPELAFVVRKDKSRLGPIEPCGELVEENDVSVTRFGFS